MTDLSRVCRETLYLLIANNCDPKNATHEDAEIITACHRAMYPQNYNEPIPTRNENR